jgi:hypothetical protein
MYTAIQFLPAWAVGVSLGFALAYVLYFFVGGFLRNLYMVGDKDI